MEEHEYCKPLAQMLEHEAAFVAFTNSFVGAFCDIVSAHIALCNLVLEPSALKTEEYRELCKMMHSIAKIIGKNAYIQQEYVQLLSALRYVYLEKYAIYSNVRLQNYLEGPVFYINSVEAVIFTAFNERELTSNLYAKLLPAHLLAAFHIPAAKEAISLNYAKLLHMLRTHKCIIHYVDSSGSSNIIERIKKFSPGSIYCLEQELNVNSNSFFGYKGQQTISIPKALRKNILSAHALERMIADPYAFCLQYILDLDSNYIQKNSKLYAMRFGSAMHELIQNCNFSEELTLEEYLKKARLFFDTQWCDAELCHASIKAIFAKKAERIIVSLYRHYKPYMKDAAVFVYNYSSTLDTAEDVKIFSSLDCACIKGEHIYLHEYKAGYIPNKSDIEKGKYLKILISALALQQLEMVPECYIIPLNTNYKKAYEKIDLNFLDLLYNIKKTCNLYMNEQFVFDALHITDKTVQKFNHFRRCDE